MLQCVMSRGSTSQETKNRGNVEGSRSALVSRSCRNTELVMNLGETEQGPGMERPGWQGRQAGNWEWGWSR